jgi:Ni/Co efflux regulator RcnB
MIKKTVLAAVAMAFIGAPLAQAQDYYPPRKPGQHRVEPSRPSNGNGLHNRHDPRRMERHQWSNGQRYGDWRRHQEIRDYKRYGLRRPGPGQHWVKVDNQYLLITAGTGIIAGILAAH